MQNEYWMFSSIQEWHCQRSTTYKMFLFWDSCTYVISTWIILTSGVCNVLPHTKYYLSVCAETHPLNQWFSQRVGFQNVFKSLKNRVSNFEACNNFASQCKCGLSKRCLGQWIHENTWKGTICWSDLIIFYSAQKCSRLKNLIWNFFEWSHSLQSPNFWSYTVGRIQQIGVVTHFEKKKIVIFSSFFFCGQPVKFLIHVYGVNGPGKISHTQSMVAKRGCTNQANVHTPIYMWKSRLNHSTAEFQSIQQFWLQLDIVS